MTIPSWHLLACAALFPASLLPAAAIAITCALRKRRAGGQEAPGAGQAPVPGSAAPPARQRQLPAPAPGPRHRTGGLEYAIRKYNCGCIHLHDGTGRLTGCTPCTPASLDDEIRDLLT